MTHFLYKIRQMKILMILAPEEFRDEEYLDARNELEKNNADVMTASSKPLAIGKFGEEVNIDLQLNEIKAGDFDAIYWVGGDGCLDFLTNPGAQKVAGDFFREGKVISAICAAPRLLLQWGILKNKKVTGWNGDNNLEKLAISGGATYTGNTVEADGRFITADGPSSAKECAQAIFEATKATLK